MCTVKSKEETKRGHTGHHLVRNVLEETLQKKKEKKEEKSK